MRRETKTLCRHQRQIPMGRLWNVSPSNVPPVHWLSYPGEDATVVASSPSHLGYFLATFQPCIEHSWYQATRVNIKKFYWVLYMCNVHLCGVWSFFITRKRVLVKKKKYSIFIYVGITNIIRESFPDNFNYDLSSSALNLIKASNSFIKLIAMGSPFL